MIKKKLEKKEKNVKKLIYDPYNTSYLRNNNNNK